MKIIDGYIKAKRKNIWCSIIQNHAIMINGIKILSIKYCKAKERNKIFLERLFVCMIIAKFWKKRNRRFAPNFNLYMQRRILYTKSFICQVMTPQIEKKAMENFEWAVCTKIAMSFKVRLAFNILIYIQKRFLLRYHIRAAKIEILENCWNKFLGQINYENMTVRDKHMSKLIVGIGKVP